MTGDPDRGFREALEDRLEGLSAPRRRAVFLGTLAEHLPEGTQAVLVGGGLVELLTEGQYVTGDLDLVGDREAIGALLDEAGFEREGRHFVHEEHGLAVELVAGQLDPSQASERLRWEGYTLTVLSLEDLVVDRLCAATFWDSATDHEQARIVYAVHVDRLDRDRLRARAEEEQVLDLLDEIASADAGDA